MRTAFLKLRLLCWLTMVGLVVLSCASPNRGDELAEESADVQANDDFTNLDEAKEDDLGDLGALGLDEPAKSDSPKVDPEILGGNIPDSVLFAPSDSEISRAAKDMAAADAAKAEAEASPTSAEFDSLEGQTASAPRSSSRGGSYSGVARVPKIPGAALSRKGALLNRFYFVRKGDTADSISQLLYGSIDQAKNLKEWNGKAWKPGKLVYYTSPNQPDDREMRSFYQERNVQPEEYQIQKGESLSMVAKKKYGNAGSWKEVAVINGITNIEGVEPGTRIALYPVDLSGYGTSPASNNGFRRSAPSQESAPPAQAATEQAPDTAPPPAYAGDDTGTDLTGEAPSSPAAGSGFSLDFQKIFRQNMVAIVFGGGIFLLILLLSALSKQKRKRKMPAMDELGDDGFTSPKRSKRK